IRLVAPTTSPGRLVGLLASADGFVYLIARLGVTGARTPVTADLARSVAAIRAHSSLPIAVGFGIDSGEQARAVAGLADGVVVGTALVRRLADGVPAARALVRELRRALDTAAVA
ncbi:MAG: tryptophan synthase subunit alpha, partial [Gemmatimonadota bacterium]|nr:tryptophan synthase subunit alpha [Gemmatimonadota bacterium]